MLKNLSRKYFYLTGVFFVLFFYLLLFNSPSKVSAQQSPQRYYDWNTYNPPPEKVLGVFAQEPSGDQATTSATPPNQEADHHDYKQYTGYVLGFTAGWTPDNPLYLLKTVQENLALTFTFDPLKKAETRLAVAGERLSEMQIMVETGKSNLVTGVADSYQKTMGAVAANLTTLKKQKQNVAPLLVAVDQEAAKHVLTLEEVAVKAPPQAAEGLTAAIQASEKTVDTVADVAGRPAVPADMVNRLDALKAQGLLTPEQITSLLSVDSRVKARGEFRKLAEAQILPSADLKRFDEGARAYFPAGYAQIIEIKKFHELKELETRKPDEVTLTSLQDFAKDYKAGDIVPSDLRRWWVPMIRLEELQNTFRPDLLSEDLFRNRPEDLQKYQEVVERVKPRAADLAYVNRVLAENPALANDPSYARIKSIGDRFGISEAVIPVSPVAQTCSRDSHWVNIPFMPNGGYCVPNLVYAPVAGETADRPCPPGYHRNGPSGPCYPDNPYGPGVGGVPSFLPAAGSCHSGYKWHAEAGSPRGGYCGPEYPTAGGGPYPGPIGIPSYCPQGQVFRDGKCEVYNPLPAEGCPSGSWWNGQKCVEQKDCGQGKFQDSSGECKSSADQYKKYESLCAGRPIPKDGCGAGYWDMASCSCKGGEVVVPPDPSKGCPPGYRMVPAPQTGFQCQREDIGGGPSCQPPSNGCPSGWEWNQSGCSCNLKAGTTPPPGSCQQPSGGCPSGWTWSQSACSCNVIGGSTGGGSGTYPTPGDTHQCGSGYYWNGSYCVKGDSGTGGYQYPTPSGSYSYPTPSGGPGSYSYPTPGGSYSYPSPSGGSYSYPSPSSGSYSYPTPSGGGGTGSYSYPSPSYGTPSYPTPSYHTPAYGTPSYGTPAYSTPSYSTPSYSTPQYSTPSYETPSYSTPSYGTPESHPPPPSQ